MINTNFITGIFQKTFDHIGAGKIYESASAFTVKPLFSSRHQTESVTFDVELEGVKSEVGLAELECGMFREDMVQTQVLIGAELLAQYPKATIPGL